MAHLRIGSRGSQLALWQANHIKALLQQQGHEVEIEIIHTTGDKVTDVPLAKVGTKGMFTKEIEEALAAGKVDLAVHSLKDLPTELPKGFEIAAITERQDPRDAFCSRHYSKIEDLPDKARVGTSSLRRQAQLKAIRPDLDIHPLRGNVDTRLRKLEEGQYDAIILASAGLKRLGKTELIKQIIPAEIMCPAAGQGALGIEIREGDVKTRELLSFLNDPSAHVVHIRFVEPFSRKFLQSCLGRLIFCVWLLGKINVFLGCYLFQLFVRLGVIIDHPLREFLNFLA